MTRETEAVRSKQNNFTIIRFIATIFVFAGHMGKILGEEAPRLGSFSLHELGVCTLFLISGYLITMSWQADMNPLRYAIRRFFRLWPPFAAMIFIMVYVAGPLLSNLGAQGYFESWYKAYLQNLRLFIVYAQPGVFEDVPLSQTTNGSLWTMPVEAVLYIITPLLLTVLRIRHRSRKSFGLMAFLTGSVCGIDLLLRVFYPEARVVFYGTELISSYHLVVWYIIGMFYTYDEVRKYLNIQLAGVAVLLLLIFQFSADGLQFLLMYIALPYFVFSFAYAEKPLFCNFGRRMELSYGIYLYGFFFQQLIVSLEIKYGVSYGYMLTFLFSVLPTLVAAILSYYLVEVPALRFGRFLLRKVNHPTERQIIS